MEDQKNLNSTEVKSETKTTENILDKSKQNTIEKKEKKKKKKKKNSYKKMMKNIMKSTRSKKEIKEENIKQISTSLGGGEFEKFEKI